MTIPGPYYILPDTNGFKGQLLDDLLAAGYYRMLHTIFTTHHTQLNEEEGTLPVFWLRTNLQKLTESSTTRTIRKKCAGFTVSCLDAAVSTETENLYSLYHAAVDFNTGGSCHACMHDDAMPNPYDSKMIEVRDGDKLVAAGFFDVGYNAITGILNCYHPDYKKYSLGKLLMLQKTDWAKNNGMQWYYTGYLCIGNNKFDYKLFPDVEAIEIFLPVERTWLPFKLLGKEILKDYWNRFFA